MKNVLFGAFAICAAPALAQEQREVPLSDTEDASLGSVSVGDGIVHPVLGLDVRNGDFVRGSYDDDAAGVGRLPVHAQLGVVWELARGDGGDATSWLMVRSSNGFHAASADETKSVRSWYETNSLVGLAARLAPGLTGAVSYAVKISPNGVSGTTNELSAALSYGAQGWIGAMHPGVTASWRPKGGGGLYTQVTTEAGFDLGSGDDGPRLSLPTTLGVGWGGFYESGSGTRAFGSAGLAIEQPLSLGSARLSARFEALAVVRDRGLSELGGVTADHGIVEPYATFSVTCAF